MHACLTERAHHGRDVFLCIRRSTIPAPRCTGSATCLSEDVRCCSRGQAEWIIPTVSERCTIVWLLVPGRDILDSISMGRLSSEIMRLTVAHDAHRRSAGAAFAYKALEAAFSKHDYDTNYGLSESAPVHLGNREHTKWRQRQAGYGWETKLAATPCRHRRNVEVRASWSVTTRTRQPPPRCSETAGFDRGHGLRGRGRLYSLSTARRMSSSPEARTLPG